MTIVRLWRVVAAGLLCASVLGVWALAGAQPASALAKERVLQIIGQITGGPVELTQSQLRRLPSASLTTNTPWTTQPTTFEGVLLGDLLETVEARGKVVNVRGWDDYEAEIAIEDCERYRVIVATHVNGQALTLRDRGPFWVIFPFDDYVELRNDSYYGKAVWQVKVIDVR